MRVAACIIQARLGSSRLPAKTMLRLPSGSCVLEEVIRRCWHIKGIGVVAVAAPDTQENDIIADVARRARTVCVRGPEHDVLARYYKAADELGADIVMRITSDCPLLDVDTCGAVLKLRETTGADYVSNSWPSRHFPHGWDCEVFTREALELADASVPRVAYGAGEVTWGIDSADATQALYDREHVTPWLQRSPDIKRAFLKDMQDRSHIRWTLDTLADYKVIWDEFVRREKEAA